MNRRKISLLFHNRDRVHSRRASASPWSTGIPQDRTAGTQHRHRFIPSIHRT